MAKETLSSNNNTFEVTSSIAPVTSQTINSGFNNEKKNFTISFRSKKNQPTTIGTLSVTAAENKRFLRSPRLVKSRKNNYITNSGVLQKKLKTVTKDSNKNITSYIYDLVYTAFEKTTIGNPIIYDITNGTRTIIAEDSGIRDVVYGKDYFYSPGAEKKIRIYGVPGTEFEIIITKITDHLNTDGDIANSFEESIIKSSLKYDTTNGTRTIINTSLITIGDGSTYTSIKNTVPNNGVFEFEQKFPKASTKTRYAINIKNSNISTKFRTGKWLLNRDKWDGWYSGMLTQHVPVTLTLRATTTSSVYTIDKNSSGSFATWNPSTPADLTYKGIFGKRLLAGKKDSNGKLNNYFTVTYVIKTSGVALSLKTGENEGVPVFATSTYSPSGAHGFRTATLSDWTNANHHENGGTLLEVDNIDATISTTSSSNDTITITFSVVVKKWGDKDVTMTLDTDTIFER